MSKRRALVTWAALVALAGGILTAGAAYVATAAKASSLSCTSKMACGGATLNWGGGTLALAVLAPDPNTNGGFGYYNEPVGVNTEDYPNGSGLQDFTAAQEAGEPGPARGGTFGFGNYVFIYTPGGARPNDPSFSTYDNAKPAQTAYCVSVQDVYRMVRGQLVQRWPTVLRPCATFFGGLLQSGQPVFSFSGATPVVSTPDPYQVWGPVEYKGGFFLVQNIGLDFADHYLHGYSGQNFVLDDTAFGLAGMQGLAYPLNGGSNQQWKGIGCTRPLTAFNPAYFNCPTGTIVTSVIVHRGSYALAA